MLGALTPPEPYRIPNIQTRQPQVNHRCLANPPFTTEEDELAVPCGCLREPPLQGLDFGLAPRDGPCSSRRHGSAVPRYEPLIPLPADGLQILGSFHRVRQGRPNLTDAHP